MVAPPRITTIHQISISSSQAAQYKSLGITAFHQISPRAGIWFGTRGSEVQILSPRPILSNNLRQQRTLKNRPTWFWPRCSSARTRINTALPLFHTMQHRPQNRPQCCDGKTRRSTDRKPYGLTNSQTTSEKPTHGEVEHAFTRHFLQSPPRLLALTRKPEAWATRPRRRQGPKKSPPRP